MKPFFVLANAALLLSLVGCGYEGPEVGQVYGTLTIDGKPASGILVNFTPVEGGRSSSGTTNEEGYYELIYSPSAMGALPGKHMVTITPPGLPLEVEAGGSSAPLVSNAIPRKYLQMKKEVEVKPGENTIDLTYP